MSDKCDSEIFEKGHSVCTLDACMHVAEAWVKEVEKESGQRVDWHYSGGIANVLYVGDHAKVLEAVTRLEPELARTRPRKPGECGSCGGSVHRPATILRLFPAEAHGPYRAGDSLPDDVIAVVTH